MYTIKRVVIFVVFLLSFSIVIGLLIKINLIDSFNSYEIKVYIEYALIMVLLVNIPSVFDAVLSKKFKGIVEEKIVGKNMPKGVFGIKQQCCFFIGKLQDGATKILSADSRNKIQKGKDFLYYYMMFSSFGRKVKVFDKYYIKRKCFFFFALFLLVFLIKIFF